MDKDKKFYVVKPDPGFSPERNKATIEEIMNEHERIRIRKMKEFDEQLGERTDAAASYLTHIAYGKSTAIEKYFGRRELAALQGRKVIQKIMNYKGKKYLQLDSI